MRTKSSSQNRRARVKPARILVPVDFSDSSARALRHAAKRAAEQKPPAVLRFKHKSKARG